MESGDLAFDAPETGVELVFRQVFQHVVAHDVAGDEFRRVRIDGDAGVVRKLLLLVELLEGHALRGNGRDHARSHDVVGLDVVQLDDVLNDLVLGVVDDTFLFAHVRHGGHFLAGNAGVRLVTGQGTTDLFHQPHEGIEDENQRVHNPGEPQEVLPVIRTDGFGDDLGEDEDQERHQGRYEAEPLAAENEGSLLAHAGGTDGVGDGVQGQDGGQGTVRVVLEFGKADGIAVALLLFHGDVGDRSGHQDRFQQGTQEGDGHGSEKEYEQQCHALVSSIISQR